MSCTLPNQHLVHYVSFSCMLPCDVIMMSSFVHVFYAYRNVRCWYRWCDVGGIGQVHGDSWWPEHWSPRCWHNGVEQLWGLLCHGLCCGSAGLSHWWVVPWWVVHMKTTTPYPTIKPCIHVYGHVLYVVACTVHLYILYGIWTLIGVGRHALISTCKCSSHVLITAWYVYICTYTR